ncbi:hypothetical protein Zmor_027066 [Zophobas morio]|jgi:hypothetical protein|uniref:Uncharacterized protein n=1 Tax=Zophobas morio TaxID=2755281 RepID=A0AA38HIT0_9CUCU|nr:hypothetical protein Zmor_027066 [Zophobas morio]
MSFIRQRRRLRLAAATQSPNDKLILNRLHRCIRKVLTAFQDSRLETKLQDMSVAAEERRPSFWCFVKRIKNRCHAQPPLLYSGGIVAESDEDKAMLFADHQAAQCASPSWLPLRAMARPLRAPRLLLVDLLNRVHLMKSII